MWTPWIMISFIAFCLVIQMFYWWTHCTAKAHSDSDSPSKDILTKISSLHNKTIRLPIQYQGMYGQDRAKASISIDCRICQRQLLQINNTLRVSLNSICYLSWKQHMNNATSVCISSNLGLNVRLPKLSTIFGHSCA